MKVGEASERAEKLWDRTLFWCNVHERQATDWHENTGHRCDPRLGGIMLPCHVVNLTGKVEMTPPLKNFEIGFREDRRDEARKALLDKVDISGYMPVGETYEEQIHVGANAGTFIMGIRVKPKDKP